MTLRIICAWCNKYIGSKNSSQEDAFPITHGICINCAEKFLSHIAEPISIFLNRFPDPVFLIDKDGRIITANKTGYSLLGKKPDEVDGKLGGDAFECRYARLPGGCGNTIHCKACTIRITVMDTMQNGRSHINVPAYPDFHFTTGNYKIRFLISTEKIKNIVLLRIDEFTELNKAESPV